MKLNALIAICESYIRLGRLDEAEKYLDKLKGLIERVNDPFLRNVSLFNYYGTIGFFYFAKNMPEKSLEAYKHRLKVAMNLDDPIYYLDTLRGLGNIYLGLGDYEKAVSILKDVNSYYRKTGRYRYFRALTELILMESLLELNRLDEALSYGLESIEFLKNTNKYWLHAGYAVLAAIYLRRGEIDKAYMYAEKAYEFLKQFNENDQVSSAIIYARVLLEKGEIEKARQIYLENRGKFEYVSSNFVKVLLGELEENCLVISVMLFCSASMYNRYYQFFEAIIPEILYDTYDHCYPESKY